MRIRLSYLVFITLFTTAAGGYAEITFLDGKTYPNFKGPLYEIEEAYGKKEGTNLFHSFGKFNIGTHETANFKGDPSIKTIISRIAGGSLSSIDGTIQSSIEGANLYLINPFGFLFGKNAAINLSGSFHAAACDYLRFDDGSILFASPIQNEILSSSSPAAFGFLDAPKGDIIAQGSSLSTVKGNTSVNSITLIGNEIKLEKESPAGLDAKTAQISAPGGRINMIAPSSSGEVVLIEEGISASCETRGNISIIDKTQAAVKEGGSIYIRGGRFIMEGGELNADTVDKDSGVVDIRGDSVLFDSGAKLSGITTGSGKGADVTIHSKGDIVFTGNPLDQNGMSQITLYSGTNPASTNTGNTGSVYLEGKNIIFDNGSKIAMTSYSLGNCGNATLIASESVQFINSLNKKWNSKIEMNANGKSKGGGSSGDILIESGTILLDRSSYLAASTYGEGNAGNITLIAADSITFKGYAPNNLYPSRLYSTSYDRDHIGGDAGELTLEADRIVFSDGSFMKAETNGTGKGGKITIKARESLVLSGQNDKNKPSSIEAETDSNRLDAGRGGSISIDAGDIILTDGAYISSKTFGAGDAGSIDILADTILLNEGSHLSVGTSGSGKGGSASIKAKGQVSLSGVDKSGISSMIRSDSSAASISSGDGGSIYLKATSLDINSGAQITSSTAASGTGKSGNAGSVSIHVSEDAVISGANLYGENDKGFSSGVYAVSKGLGAGNAGNIDFRVDQNLTMETGGVISTSADGPSKGGDIQIFVGNTLSISGDTSSIQLQPPLKSQKDFLKIHPTDLPPFSISGVYAESQSEAPDSGNSGGIDIRSSTIWMNDNGTISTSSEGGGDAGLISLSAAYVSLSGRAAVSSVSRSLNYGGNAGTVLINAGEAVYVSDFSLISTSTQGSGNAGNVTIYTGTLCLDTGSEISSSSNSRGSGGNGGSLSLYACDSVSLDHFSRITTSSLGFGNAGSVDILTPNLSADHDSEITSASLAYGISGNAGVVHIRNAVDSSDTVTLNNGSRVATVSSGSGNAGDIDMDASDVKLSSRASISSSSSGSGNAGTIFVHSTHSEKSSIALSNSSITTSTSGTGDAGTITLETQELNLDDHAVIASSSLCSGTSGNAGSVAVSAGVGPSQEIRLQNNSSLTTSTSGLGVAGTITLQTQKLYLQDNSSVSSSSLSSGPSGNAGSITVSAGSEASRLISLQNSSSLATSTSGFGSAGTITLFTHEMLAENESTVSSSSLSTGQSGNGGSIIINAASEASPIIRIHNNSEIMTLSNGTGDAGSIFIDADALDVSSSTISSSNTSPEFSGKGGFIAIAAKDSPSTSVVLTNQSLISTSTYGNGTAGIITIDVNDFYAEKDSQVSSSSNFGGGDAGQIIIKAKDKPADSVRLSSASMATTTSGSGNAGSIMLDAVILELIDGSISSSSYFNPDGGSAGTISIQGRSNPESAVYLLQGSVISTSAAGIRDAGSVFINSGRLDISSKSMISSSNTGGGGNSGSILIQTDDSHTGEISLDSGSIISTSNEGKGNAGSIALETSRLSLSSGSSVTSSSLSKTDGGNAGEILIHGKGRSSETIRITDGSAIQTISEGKGNAGSIQLLTQYLDIESGSAISSSCLHPDQSGDAGLIEIGSIEDVSARIRLSDAGGIATSNNGSGKGGNIQLRSEQVILNRESSIKSSGVHGGAGRISMDSGNSLTSQILLDNSSEISTSSYGSGTAGNIRLNAAQVHLNHESLIASSSAAEDYGGNAGSVSIYSDGAGNNTLTLQNKSGLSTMSRNSGNAGDITVAAEQIDLSSGSWISSASLSPEHSGNGGMIVISGGTKPADAVILKDNSVISTSSEGDGSGGSIHMMTHLLVSDNSFISASGNNGGAGHISIYGDYSADGSMTQMTDVFLDNTSYITTSSAGTGSAGDIRFLVNNLDMKSGSRVASESKASGQSGPAGVIDIFAKMRLTLYGKDTGVTTSSEGSGNAGSIRLTQSDLMIGGGAYVSSESHAQTGGGSAGSIVIRTDQSAVLDAGASVTTQSVSSGGGQIFFFSDALNMTDSRMTTSVLSGAGNGGDISIDSGSILLKKSQIIANAYEGRGGNILLVSTLFVPSADSQLSASSEFGLEGSVRIESPEKNIVNVLSVMPSDFLNADQWVQTPCSQRSGEAVNRFVYRSFFNSPTAFSDLLPSSGSIIDPAYFYFPTLFYTGSFLKEYFNMSAFFEEDNAQERVN